MYVCFILDDHTRDGGDTLAYFFDTWQENEDTRWGILRRSDMSDERRN